MPKKPHKTKPKILKECVRHIQRNGRALAGDKCVYKNDKGQVSFCGYCFSYNKVGASRLRRFNRPKNDVYRLTTLFSSREGFDYLLKAEFKGHSIHFWADLQNFHDHPDCWIDHGTKSDLTEFGKTVYANLLVKHNG